MAIKLEFRKGKWIAGKDKYHKGIRQGEIIYTILRHVSRSGMYRVIDAVIMRKNEPVSIFAVLSQTAKDEIKEMYKLEEKGTGFKVNGCGMDMGFDLVYNISSLLFKNTQHNKKQKEDVGYWLKQRWL